MSKSAISASAAVGGSFAIDSNTYDVVYENGFEYLEASSIDDEGKEVSYGSGETGISWTGCSSGVTENSNVLSGNHSISLKKF